MVCCWLYLSCFQEEIYCLAIVSVSLALTATLTPSVLIRNDQIALQVFSCFLPIACTSLGHFGVLTDIFFSLLPLYSGLLCGCFVSYRARIVLSAFSHHVLQVLYALSSDFCLVISQLVSCTSIAPFSHFKALTSALAHSYFLQALMFPVSIRLDG